jgi:small-conductance mechanosensitive channel
MAFYTDDMYPVQFSVDYPEEPRNRLTALVRVILAIPILVILALIVGYFNTGNEETSINTFSIALIAGGGIWIATILMILFRHKYPRWWFDWGLEVQRFSARVGAYIFLLRDEYPSTDEEQSVHLDIAFPDVEGQLNRFMPLVKWILAIPHYIALFVLGFVVVVLTIIAWFAILILGRYPRGIFDFVVGVSRWAYRVTAYAFLLTTDRYPPFSLS